MTNALLNIATGSIIIAIATMLFAGGWWTALALVCIAVIAAEIS